eukprot:3941241-Rhodomonas_salina.1
MAVLRSRISFTWYIHTLGQYCAPARRTNTLPISTAHRVAELAQYRIASASTGHGIGSRTIGGVPACGVR